MVQSTLCLVMSMIEGEEEIGSKVWAGLGNQEKLKNDVI
jgi:hypothetical protein